MKAAVEGGQSAMFEQKSEQGVTLGIGDFWVVEDVVPLFVMANAVAKFFDLTLDRIHDWQGPEDTPLRSWRNRRYRSLAKT